MRFLSFFVSNIQSHQSQRICFLFFSSFFDLAVYYDMNNKKRRKVVAMDAAAITTKIVNNNPNLAKVIVNTAVLDQKENRKKKKPRLLRKFIPSPTDSIWTKIDRDGDDQELLFFTAFTRSSFNLLVQLITPEIISQPTNPRFDRPQKYHLSKRMFSPRDIVAMVIKSMTTVAEAKDIFVQIGATKTVFSVWWPWKKKVLLK